MTDATTYYRGNTTNLLSTTQARMQNWYGAASNIYTVPDDDWSTTVAAGASIQTALDDPAGGTYFLLASAPYAPTPGASGYWSASVAVPEGTTTGQVTVRLYAIEGDTTSSNYHKLILTAFSSNVSNGRVGTTFNLTSSTIKRASFVMTVAVAAGAGSKKISAASITQGNSIFLPLSPVGITKDDAERCDVRLVIYRPDGSKRMMPLADNIQFSSAISDAGALSFEHPKDGDISVLLDNAYLEVAVEITYDGGYTWHEYPNCRFYRSGLNTEDTALNGNVSVSMGCISNILLNMAIVDLSPLLIDASGNRPFHAATVGAIFVRLFTDNHNIGVGTGIDFTGSSTLDSNGKAWSNTLEVSFAPGTTLRSMLDSFVGLGVCEWVMIGRNLYVYDPSSDKNSTGLWACDRTGVILQRAIDVETSSSSKSDAGLITKALAIGNAGTNYIRTSASAPSPWGHLLGVQSEANADSVTLQKITDTMLKNGAGVQNQQTVNLVLATTPYIPFANYKIGDYIYPDLFDDQLPAQSRVVQFSFAKSNQMVTASAVLNNRYIQSLILLARKQAGLVNGSVTPKNSKLATLIPKPPISLGVTSNTFIDNDVVRCTVDITWTEVPAATDGTALDITGFDIYGRQVTGTGATATDGLYSQVSGGQHQLTLTNLRPGCQYTFKVRQTAYGTQAGTFSGYVTIITPFPAAAPSTPSIPVLSSRNGATQISWDGLDNAGLAMPPEFKNVKVQRATNAAFTGTVTAVGVMVVAGTNHVMNVTDLVYGTMYYFRLIAYTTDNRNSLPSQVVSIMVGQTTGSDIADGSVGMGHVDDTIKTPIIDAGTKADNANNNANTANDNANAAKSIADAAAAQAATALANANNAQTTANGKNKTFYQTAAPVTGMVIGDLWFDIDDGNKPYSYNGSSWVTVQDASIAVAQLTANTAQTNANAAQSTANGKNKVTYSTSVASGSGTATGDLWFQTNVSGIVIGQWQWNGVAWVSQTIDSVVIANLDAAKITTGYLSSARIQANTLTVAHLMVTSVDNLVDNPQFLGGTATWQPVNGVFSVNATGARNNGPVGKITHAVGSATTLTSAPVASQVGQYYKITWWVNSSVALTAGQLSMGVVLTSTSNTSTSFLYFSAPALLAGVWTRLTYTMVNPTGTGTSKVSATIQIADTAPACTLSVDQVILNLASDGTLVVDGTITASKMVTGTITAASGIIGSIDAATITTGILNGNLIAANSITANKLTLTSTANVVDNSQFLAGQVGWAVTPQGAGVIAPNASRSGTQALQITPDNFFSLYSNTFGAQAGQYYKVSVWAKTSIALAANSLSLSVQYKTTGGSSGTVLAAEVPALVADTWTLMTGMSPALPTNTIQAMVVFSSKIGVLPVGTVITVDQVTANLGSDSSLIVDGSIDGKTITGSTIRTGPPPIARIEITGGAAPGIREYDSSNVVISQWLPGEFTITGGQITGGVFRTAASGPRVELRDNLFSDVSGTWQGIRFYDATTNYAPSAVMSDSATGNITVRAGQQTSASKDYSEVYLYANGDWKITDDTALNYVQNVGTTMTMKSGSSTTITGGANATVYLEVQAGRLRWGAADQFIWTEAGTFAYGAMNYRVPGVAATIWKNEAVSSTLARITGASTSVNFELYMGSSNKMLLLDFAGGWQFYNSGGDRAFQVHSSGQYNYGKMYFRAVGQSWSNSTIESTASGNLLLNQAGNFTVDANQIYFPNMPTTSSAGAVIRIGAIGTGNIVWYANTSSRRYKKNIKEMDADLRWFGIKPVSFNYRDTAADIVDETELRFGLIAEDLHDAGLTELVKYKDIEGLGMVPDSIDYDALPVVELALIQRQEKLINDLLERVTVLENR